MAAACVRCVTPVREPLLGELLLRRFLAQAIRLGEGRQRVRSDLDGSHDLLEEPFGVGRGLEFAMENTAR